MKNLRIQRKTCVLKGERLKKQCNQGSAQVKEEPSGGQRRRPPLEPFAPSGLQAQDLEKHIPVRGRKL